LGTLIKRHWKERTILVEAANRMRLPTGRVHDLVERSTLGSLEHGQHVSGLASVPRN
jgi:hypothetical protein